MTTRRFSAADPAGQEYMEFKGIPCRMDQKKIDKLWEKQKNVAQKSDQLGFIRESDQLDMAMRRIAQAQGNLNAPASSQQMSEFMQAVNQLSGLIVKQEQRIVQVEQKLNKLQETVGGAGAESSGDNTLEHNNFDITAPPGTNLNVSANNPNESNSEINL